jgi:hypothetical protein
LFPEVPARPDVLRVVRGEHTDLPARPEVCSAKNARAVHDCMATSA